MQSDNQILLSYNLLVAPQYHGKGLFPCIFFWSERLKPLRSSGFRNYLILISASSTFYNQIQSSSLCGRRNVLLTRENGPHDAGGGYYPTALIILSPLINLLATFNTIEGITSLHFFLLGKKSQRPQCILCKRPRRRLSVVKSILLLYIYKTWSLYKIKIAKTRLCF